MDYVITYTNWKSIYEAVTSQEKIAKEQLLSNYNAQLASIQVDTETWIDMAVDIVSGLIDLVPILGTAVSGVVDIVHALSYILRAVLTSSVTRKIEYFILGIVGIGTSFIPIGGNIANAAAKLGISNALKLSPKLLVKVPLIKNSKAIVTWATSTPWKFDFLTVIISYFKNKAIAFISEIHEIIEKIFNQIIPILREWINNWAVGSIAISLISGIKSLYYLINDFKAYAPILLRAMDKIS